MRRYFNEKVLIYRIQQGDTEAFTAIYDHFIEKVYRFIYLKVPTQQDAEDIAGETFLKVWHHIANQKSVTHLQALIYSVARNLVVDFYRKRGGTHIESIEETEPVIADRVDLTLEEKMHLKTEMANVESALRELKDTYREIIVLHFLNELSLTEIAHIVDRSPGAVRVILHRGLKALRSKMAS